MLPVSRGPFRPLPSAGKSGTTLSESEKLGGHVSLAPTGSACRHRRVRVGSRTSRLMVLGAPVSGGGTTAQIWQVRTSPAIHLVQQSVSAPLNSGQIAVYDGILKRNHGK